MRSVEELKADAKASSFFTEDGALILFGKLVSAIVPDEDGKLLVRWVDGSSLGFPNWMTLIAVIWESLSGEESREVVN